MVKNSRWIETNKSHGMLHVKISSWEYFDDYIREKMLDYKIYVWRGHRKSNWLLEPALDRFLAKYTKREQKFIAKFQLQSFKYASRGRRGSNPPQFTDDNDWWALGQHYGLLTPLLDWTFSPFVAAYFSYFGTGKPQTTQRAIYGLCQSFNHIKLKGKNKAIKFIKPMLDENTRLVNQGGVFSRVPIGVDIESSLVQHAPKVSSHVNLIKITIPDKDRELALKSLNRMNINHSSLFPDLFGSSKFCNLGLEIGDY